MLLSMITSVSIMMLTLLVYRLIVAGLTQSFWLTCFLSPLFFRFPPPRFSGREYRSLAWILAAFLDSSCMLWTWARYGFSTLGIATFMFSFSVSDDVILCTRLVYLGNWHYDVADLFLKWFKILPLLYLSTYSVYLHIYMSCPALLYHYACLPIMPLQS